MSQYYMNQNRDTMQGRTRWGCASGNGASCELCVLAWARVGRLALCLLVLYALHALCVNAGTGAGSSLGHAEAHALTMLCMAHWLQPRVITTQGVPHEHRPGWPGWAWGRWAWGR